MVITLSLGLASMPVLIHFKETSMARSFSKSFYDSREWAAVRSYVLMRDHYTCTRCNNPAEEVHHITRLSPENIWDKSITLNPDNLISLCKDCHFAEHKAEKEAGQRRARGTSAGDCREGYHFDENGMLVPDHRGDEIPPGSGIGYPTRADRRVRPQKN